MTKRKRSIDIKVGEALEIGGAIVALEKKSGQQARLVIVAEESIPILSPQQRIEARTSASLPTGVDGNGKHTLRRSTSTLS